MDESESRKLSEDPIKQERLPPGLSQSSPYMQVVTTEDITPELIKSLKPKVESFHN